MPKSARYSVVILISILLSLAIISGAIAKPFRLGKLPDRGSNFRCATCHKTPGGPRNPFGQDYENIAIKAGDIYTEELGKMDSDGDGFSNDNELTSGTNPGEAESKPEGAATTTDKEVQEEDQALAVGNYIYDAGRYLALLGLVAIFLQYIHSSKIRFIEQILGLDKFFMIHRKIGVVGFILILAHPVLLYIYNGLDGYSSLLKVVGLVAWLILIAVAVAALLLAKLNLKYETWKNIHRASYAVFPIAFLHSIFIGSNLHGWSPLKILWLCLGGAYALIMIYKIIKWAYVRRHPFVVDEVSQETHDVWSVYFDGKHRKYIPGQFMIINLVRNGKASESHPFTISSSPTRDRLSISVKSVGDFTSTIGDTKPSDLAYIDEPYGKFSFLNHDAHNLVFIAGGIGITPFISALRYIYDEKLERDVTLIWANKTENDIAFRDELEKMASEMPALKVIHVMSKQEDWEGEKGYIDADMLKRLVSNFQDSQFFICGPPIMMSSIEKALKGLGVPKRRIHYERFALR